MELNKSNYNKLKSDLNISTILNIFIVIFLFLIPISSITIIILFKIKWLSICIFFFNICTFFVISLFSFDYLKTERIRILISLGKFKDNSQECEFIPGEICHHFTDNSNKCLLCDKFKRASKIMEKNKNTKRYKELLNYVRKEFEQKSTNS